MSVVFLGLLLLPVGAVLLLMGLKWRKVIIPGLMLVFLSLPAYWTMREFLVWQYDGLRGWSMSLPVDLPMYRITVIQKPGVDFYDSYFEVERNSDGKKAWVLIDGDDHKWKQPRIRRQDGRIYFLRDQGTVIPGTPYIDLDQMRIFSGYYQRFYRLEDLEFFDSDSSRLYSSLIPVPSNS